MAEVEAHGAVCGRCGGGCQHEVCCSQRGRRPLVCGYCKGEGVGRAGGVRIIGIECRRGIDVLLKTPVQGGIRSQGLSVTCETDIGCRYGSVGKKAYLVSLLKSRVGGFCLEGAYAGLELDFLADSVFRGGFLYRAGGNCRRGKDQCKELNVSFHYCSVI